MTRHLPYFRGVAHAGRWQFINASGSAVVDKEFDGLRPMSEGLAAAQFDWRWGFVDWEGTYVIPPLLKSVDLFSNGLARARADDDLWGYLRPNGEWHIALQFELCEPFFSGRAFAQLPDGDYSLIDSAGRILGNSLTYTSRFHDGIACVGKALDADVVKWSFIDVDGSPVFPSQFDFAAPFRCGLACVADGEYGEMKYGYISRQGELKIPSLQDAPADFSEGIAFVVRSGRYCILSRHGKVNRQLDWSFEVAEIDPLSEGLARLTIGDSRDEVLDRLVNPRVGYLYPDGRVAIEPRYYWGEEFSGGLARVFDGNEFYYINCTGERIWPPTNRSQVYREMANTDTLPTRVALHSEDAVSEWAAQYFHGIAPKTQRDHNTYEFEHDLLMRRIRRVAREASLTLHVDWDICFDKVCRTGLSLDTISWSFLVRLCGLLTGAFAKWAIALHVSSAEDEHSGDVFITSSDVVTHPGVRFIE